MLGFLILLSVTVGLACGRLYSVVALLLTSPLLALVGYAAAAGRGWTIGPALLIGGVTLGLAQLAYLAGVRLRLDSLPRTNGEEAGQQATAKHAPAMPSEKRYSSAESDQVAS